MSVQNAMRFIARLRTDEELIAHDHDWGIRTCPSIIGYPLSSS